MSRSGKSRKVVLSTVTSVTRQEDWGKGLDLRAYLTIESDASDGKDATCESLSVIESVPKPTSEIPKLETPTLPIGNDRSIQEGLASEKKPISLDSINLLSGPHTLPLDEFHQGTCHICKREDEIGFYFEDFKRERHDLCDECSWNISKSLEQGGMNG